MDAEMLRNVLTMLGTVLGAILVLMLVAKITSMVHVEADDARAPIDSMEASVVGKRTLVTQEDGARNHLLYDLPEGERNADGAGSAGRGLRLGGGRRSGRAGRARGRIYRL